MFLQIKNVCAGYKGNEALHNVSLALEPKEAVCLIGPNGAGKSTVLKSIMGIAQVSSGEIFWKGREITRLPAHTVFEGGIGYVPQGRLVFARMTVRENIEMGGYLLNHRETFEKNFESVFARFPVLKKKSRMKAGFLSGGEQQMLAIGRALMMVPDLLMLDEPSLGLSPKVIHEVFEKLEEIRVAGTALLIVEQNVRLVTKHTSRGYLLAGGKIKFFGSSLELGSEKLMHASYLM